MILKPHWIDAGVLIQSERKLFRREIIPQFWTFLDAQIAAGLVKMPRIAYEEITDGGYKDDLAQWCRPRKAGLCVNPSKAVQKRYGEIAAHLQGKNHEPRHVAEFLRGADGWVIAHALAEDGVVVTQENERPGKSKIKVPTVAKALGVKWCDVHEMLRVFKADLSGR